MGERFAGSGGGFLKGEKKKSQKESKTNKQKRVSDRLTSGVRQGAAGGDAEPVSGHGGDRGGGGSVGRSVVGTN